MSDLAIINQPLSVQVALGTGYIAYCISHHGIKTNHKALDAVLNTLSFSIMTTLFIAIMQLINIDIAYSTFIACILTLIFAIYWRRTGQNIFNKVIRISNTSWSDSHDTALATISQNTSVYTTQIDVKLDDETMLRCHDTRLFNDAPFNPIIIGNTGDIGIYVTKIIKAGEVETSANHTIDNKWGYRITYIPSHRIKEIRFRHRQRETRNPAIVNKAHLIFNRLLEAVQYRSR